MKQKLDRMFGGCYEHLPLVNVEGVWNHNGQTPHIMINTYPFLTEILDDIDLLSDPMDREINKIWDDVNHNIYDFENEVINKHHLVDSEYTTCGNTYNSQILYKDVNYHTYDIKDYNCTYIIIKLHLGGDIRYNYTQPELFRIYDICDIFNCHHVSCYCNLCYSEWYSDDNMHWYGRNGKADMHNYGTLHFCEETKKILCPECEKEYLIFKIGC